MPTAWVVTVWLISMVIGGVWGLLIDYQPEAAPFAEA